MRTLPAGLAASLANGATTFARVWRVIRTDGVVVGFTDHDRDIAFDGVVHRAVAAFDRSDVPSSAGLSVDTSEVAGELAAPGLSETDLAAGRFDDATVEVVLVDWMRPEDRFVLSRGTIGEVTRQGGAFRAEVRSLAHRLHQEQGRILSSLCDADFADARCKASLAVAGRSASGTVAGVEGRRIIVVAGLASIPAGWLARGRLTFDGGALAGLRFDVVSDDGVAAARRLTLAEVPSAAMTTGDAFTAVVGCDKRLATCRDRFANAVNFRGFPHLPGLEHVLGYVRAGGRNDGGSLSR